MTDRTPRPVADPRPGGAPPPPLPVVPLHEVAHLLYGPRLPIRYTTFREITPPTDIAERALRAAGNAHEQLGLDQTVKVVFVEPVGEPAADFGLALRGFTVGESTAIVIVLPHALGDIEGTVTHEMAHLRDYRAGRDSAGHESEANARAATSREDHVPLATQMLATKDMELHVWAEGAGPRSGLGEPRPGTVIIDGTSNMFKISAAGSLSCTAPAWSSGNLAFGSTSVTLTALGSMSVPPAHLSFVGNTTDPLEVRRLGSSFRRYDAPVYVAAASGGSPTTRLLGWVGYGIVSTRLNASDQARVELTAENVESSSRDWHGYYHVLQEAAL